jgi:hypothetical protein
MDYDQVRPIMAAAGTVAQSLKQSLKGREGCDGAALTRWLFSRKQCA